MSDIVIKFDNVSKTYRLYKNDKQRLIGLLFKSKRIQCRKFIAINKMSFEIRKGESVGIVGRNGAGKSTMLKLITKVAFPDKGTVYVKGQVSALLELSAGFNMEMTGRENIYLRGYVLGLTPTKIKSIEQDVINFAELGDFIDQPVRTYSSGMKARLGFAINVSVKPDILVIDEALSVGDAVFSRKCRDKVHEIISGGATVLFVSHNAANIKQFCTRAILLDKGTLLAEGSVEEINEKYNTMIAKRKPRK